MSSNRNFQENSLGWQLQQWQQRLGEWWEWQLSQFRTEVPKIPDWSIADWVGLLIQYVVVLLFLLLLVWLIWRFAQIIPIIGQRLHRSKSVSAQPTIKTELSFEKWLRKSSKYQQAGNYEQACRCLYFAMLQHLDDQGLIPQLLSRTDGEYLKLLLELPYIEPYITLLDIHQELCFSDRPASPLLYENCQQALRAIVDWQEQKP